ncbi:oxygenase MpaB family protein [Acidicapsa dinghuensis]|uniref:Oxygenase MpaB family protein n=1 Tax=Acidicapsa dinghuensis TaxID=2218256 RepID=A0ABW1EAG4_9BACT|nr:oxygenase MpaB family protein [Acidicapsa dinghuensis]
MGSDFRPVSRENIEALWLQLEERAAAPGFDRRAGIFGPGSVSWRVNRESALFLGAGRAALLQLAHPWVAASLDQHSTLRADPLARFHNTFRIVFTMVFGSFEQAMAASHHLYRLHTHIEGELATDIGTYHRGSRYMANEVNALLWVFATLIDSALLAYESVLAPLSDVEREAYYTESKMLAALFGIPAEAMPGAWSDFAQYMHDVVAGDQLGVDPVARQMAGDVLHGKGSWIPVPGWYRALTAAWLPDRMRVEFNLPFDESQQLSGQRAQRWLRHIVPRMPAVLRFVGPYHEARSRLCDKQPGLATRASNRFWMGSARMMFGEQ